MESQKDYLDNLLQAIASNAASNGLMTSDSIAEVVSWDANVEERE